MAIQSERRVLITGSTGMVGAHVMAQLLRAGQPVAALARSRRGASAESRVNEVLSHFENHWGQRLPRPRVLTGTLHERNLGLSAADERFVGEHCHAVLHSAANLSFTPAAQSRTNEPFRTNVEGTQNLLAFATANGIEKFHHISTAYVCGTRCGVVLETENDVSQEFANDYERSKSRVEAMLQTSWDPAHLTIYRPSIVVDQEGLAPVPGDRTIYGLFSMYRMLVLRLGMPQPGQWRKLLDLQGHEQKNLIEAQWVARAIITILHEERFHGATYHLTAPAGVTSDVFDEQLRRVNGGSDKSIASDDSASMSDDALAEIGELARPFVATFQPYLRDDPRFDQTNLSRVVNEGKLEPAPTLDATAVRSLAEQWYAREDQRSGTQSQTRTSTASPHSDANRITSHPPISPARVRHPHTSDSASNDPIVIVGHAVRLAGGVDDLTDFEDLLFDGRSGIAEMPDNRLDRRHYFNPERGKIGKTYTTRGGCVNESPLCDALESQITKLGEFDLSHRQFAQIAASAFADALDCDLPTFASQLANRSLAEQLGIAPERMGVLVGHSGGTATGGPLSLSTMAKPIAELIDVALEPSGRDHDPGHQAQPNGVDLTTSERLHLKETFLEELERDLPHRRPGGAPHVYAYAAASLAARLLGLGGRREVIDAACSSSLLALQHAVTALQQSKLDLALVGGATFNNVDNLILFSQAGACGEGPCCPFDRDATGLISSEGYVAVIATRRSIAEQRKLPILAEISRVNISSDGRGKGLWAPLTDGQQLAMRRGDTDVSKPLDVDYVECHATSTRVGDATELESLQRVLSDFPDPDRVSKLLIGSVKSNLGHTLESAGLVGLVKCLIALRREAIPPSIHFKRPTDDFDWQRGNLSVVDQTTPWPNTNPERPKSAAINAFGIGGLNAHAVLRAPTARSHSADSSIAATSEPIAIVGRGVVLPGAGDLASFRDLMRSDRTALIEAPSNRWPLDAAGQRIGVDPTKTDFTPGVIPHCLGGYITDFHFDAQAFRIPPKLIANANPAQLMLIDAAHQALQEMEPGVWSQDKQNAGHESSVSRERFGVIVGSIFGGQFGNDLQVGLRGSELRSQFAAICRDIGLDENATGELEERFAKVLRDRFNALEDETGGFTASTLASRLTRTFDLMGGSCALDADEASGSLAIVTAIEQLRAGHVDAVLCGVSQRAMDLAAFEQLHSRGQLATSTRLENLDHQTPQIVPGEGVAVLILQRHRDAIAAGKTVYGLIENCTETMLPDEAPRQMERTSLEGRLLHKIGHLGGAQQFVHTIANTLEPTMSKATQITATALDGYQIGFTLASPPNQTPGATPPSETGTTIASVPVAVNSLAVTRLQSASLEGMERDLERLAAGDPADRLVSRVERFSGFPAPSIAIVAETPGQQRAEAESLLATVRQRRAGTSRSGGAWFWNPITSSATGHHQASRIAWLFPGQGSQYSAALAPLTETSSADWRDIQSQLDTAFETHDLPAISSWLSSPPESLGKDIWVTQAWTLAASVLFTHSLASRGHRPDVVLGHSFGQCTAAWHAGVMSLPQTVRFAQMRSRAVITHAQRTHELLSIRSTPEHIAHVISRIGVSFHLTHHNAPQQTVIAIASDDLSQVRAELRSAKISHTPIAVPVAYHTPMLHQAQSRLQRSLADLRLKPPICAFYSSTQSCYLAEPTDISRDLIGQLTQPVCFVDAMERLVHDDCDWLIEVGPNDVLTRLAQQTSPHTIALSLDNRRHRFLANATLIDLAYEVLGRTSDLRSRDVGQTPRKRRSQIAVVDVTATALENATPSAKSKPASESTHAGNNSHLSLKSTTGSPEQRGSLSDSETANQLHQLMIDLVVDQTGYDRTIIDLDADLEAELGIDSIKRAQLIGELEQHYQLQSLRESSLRLSDFPSLRTIGDFILDKMDAGNISHNEAASNNTSVGMATEPSGVDGQASLAELERHSSACASNSTALVNPDVAPPPEVPATLGRVTERFTIKWAQRPHRGKTPAIPTLRGSALVVGQGKIADALVARLHRLGQEVVRLGHVEHPDELEWRLDAIFQRGFCHQLFLATSLETDALRNATDDAHWSQRRWRGLELPYRVCQRWMTEAIDKSLIHESAIVSLIDLDHALESGAMAGLTKAMRIEAWMRGFRETPILVIDLPEARQSLSDDRTNRLIDGVLKEVAVPTHDLEVRLDQEGRWAPCPEVSPLPATESEQHITPGGHWVVAGGGRGITAAVAMEFAKRHHLCLHLLGMAPRPDIDSATRERALQDRMGLRRDHMRQHTTTDAPSLTGTSVDNGRVAAWRDLEKAIEIDQTLTSCARAGIPATYHSVDVSDPVAVAKCLDQIRRTHGAIRGVIQGAGSGQDARFDRKRADKVRKCFQAKIDGTIALAAATQHDPLEWFIGFGSISGRFGANGHTDYSAANAMLASLIDGIATQRDKTNCVTLHWHAWGDIGMATKPEARLALDMIGMQLMPAREGIEHCVRELERGGQDTQAVITDRKYIRKFFATTNMDGPNLPLLDDLDVATSGSVEFQWQTQLNASDEVFLSQHLVGDRPTLPMVVAIEWMAEAAWKRLGERPCRMEQIEAIAPLKCNPDGELRFRVASEETAMVNLERVSHCTIRSDLKHRDGRIVQADRLHFQARIVSPSAQFDSSFAPRKGNVSLARVPGARDGDPQNSREGNSTRFPIVYPEQGAVIYHGQALRTLRCIQQLDRDPGDSEKAAQTASLQGTLVTPSPVELGGDHRPTTTWVVPCAVLDGVLYSAGVLVHRAIGRASLPVRIGALTLGRQPDPGEPLTVAVRWDASPQEAEGMDPESAGNPIPTAGRLQATLTGHNGDMILELADYEVGLLHTDLEPSVSNSRSYVTKG
ncbi:MAG: SDR family NAD(P)-dependent oxidoreductase [Planctomycetota bacterium]